MNRCGEAFVNEWSRGEAFVSRQMLRPYYLTWPGKTNPLPLRYFCILRYNIIEIPKLKLPFRPQFKWRFRARLRLQEELHSIASMHDQASHPEEE